MGDIVHNLPAVADLHAAVPGCRIDWVVEKSFSAIPALHPGVGEIIPVSIRRWRSRPFSAATREEFSGFRARLRDARYDAVIDSQGLLKSALISWLANGRSHGLDFKSSREPLGFLYDKTYSIPWTVHAVQRNRLLAAAAVGYELKEPPSYGIAPADRAVSALTATFPIGPSQKFAVLLHATSAANKEWPEGDWIQLGTSLAAHGISSVLPFGNATEKARSERLGARIAGARVPPALDLDSIAALLSLATIVIGVDTGLSHLAVALGRPTIGLYVSTDPAATGLFGSTQAKNLGGRGRTPSVDDARTAAISMLGKA